MHYLILIVTILLVVIQKNNIYETYKNQYKILRSNAIKNKFLRSLIG